MLVYGDSTRRERPADKLDAIRAELGAASGADSWITGHAHLVAALIEAGELEQGIADAEWAVRGDRDEVSPLLAACERATLVLARAVLRSWNGGDPIAADGIGAALAAIPLADSPEEIAVTRPEGFAHYGVYPELFGMAATRAGLPPNSSVVGLRSIGTTLAATVAAALDGADRITVRPQGHPFDRRIVVGERLAARIAGARAVAIVDEGPGLSGSSFAAAARLATDSAPGAALHLFPSHGNGPGPETSAAAGALWTGNPTHLAAFDETMLRSPEPRHRLESWVADLTGLASGPLEDIGGGAWRARLWPDPASWPPVLRWAERRKFLLRSDAGPWLLRFAGLGREGREAARRAAELGRAGFGLPVAGYRHGFTVQPWREDAVPLPLAEVGRDVLVGRVGAYLAFRCSALPATERDGAPLDALLAMARANVGEELGPEAAMRLDAWGPRLPGLAAKLRRVMTDNRMHAAEWLVLPGGKLVKTDGADHARGHDLVGPQDIAWDVAGAQVELAFDEEETSRVAALVDEGAARPVEPELVSFFRPCYCAFQLGSARMAQSGADATEAARFEEAAARYRRALLADLPGFA